LVHMLTMAVATMIVRVTGFNQVPNARTFMPLTSVVYSNADANARVPEPALAVNDDGGNLPAAGACRP
jgi:hypothetical protein